jgi:hypothetical protein
MNSQNKIVRSKTIYIFKGFENVSIGLHINNPILLLILFITYTLHVLAYFIILYYDT